MGKTRSASDVGENLHTTRPQTHHDSERQVGREKCSAREYAKREARHGHRGASIFAISATKHARFPPIIEHISYDALHCFFGGLLS
jgi:hypothetical protein